MTLSCRRLSMLFSFPLAFPFTLDVVFEWLGKMILTFFFWLLDETILRLCYEMHSKLYPSFVRSLAGCSLSSAVYDDRLCASTWSGPSAPTRERGKATFCKWRLLISIYRILSTKEMNPITRRSMSKLVPRSSFSFPRSPFPVPVLRFHFRSSFHRSPFPIPRSPFPVPRSSFLVPRSAFRVPRSSFPVPRSSFPVPFYVLVNILCVTREYTC